MFKAFIKDSVIYAIPAFISRGISLILIPLYTRVLSPADYGSLDLLMVFMSIINLTVALEVSQGVARFYPAETEIDRKVSYASTAFWFTLASYFLVSAIALINSDALSALVMGRDGLASVFRIGVVCNLFNGLFYLIQNQLRFEFRSMNYSICSMFSSFVTAGVAVWLAYYLKWGLEGLLYGMLAGAVAGCAYGLWHLRSSFRFRFDTARLKEMLVFSAPLVPSGIAVFISMYVDRMMINHFLTTADVGLYGIAFRLAGVVGLILMGFQGALTPLVMSRYQEPETPIHLEKIFRIFLAFGLLTFLVLSIFAHEILVFMTTPEYYSSASLVVYLVPAILLSNMYIFAAGIGIAKRTYMILWINVMGAILNALFNWIFIQLWGVSGAAIGTLLGYFCVFSAYMYFSQKLYPVPHVWRNLMVASVAISGVAWWVSRLELTGVMVEVLKVAAVVIGLVVIMLTRLIKGSELENALNLLRKKLDIIY